MASAGAPFDDCLAALAAFDAGDWAKWDWLAGPTGLLRRGLRAAVAKGPASIDALAHGCRLAAGERIETHLARFYRDEYHGVRIDAARVAKSLGLMLDTATVAAGLESMPGRIQSVLAAWLDDPQEALAEQTSPALQRCRAACGPGVMRAWLDYWLARPDHAILGRLRVPVLAFGRGEGFVAYLELARKAGDVPELSLHPETALLPFGVAFHECLEAAWRRHPVTVQVRLALPAERQLMPMDGDSAGAVLTVAFDLLARGLPLDDDLAVTAGVDESDALVTVGHEYAKGQAAAHEGFRRLVLAVGHQLAASEADALAAAGLVCLPLPDLAAATAQATTLARGVREYLDTLLAADRSRAPGAGERPVSVELTLLAEQPAVESTTNSPRTASATWGMLTEQLRSESRRRLVLIGEFGAGKTTLLRRLSAELAATGDRPWDEWALPVHLPATELFAEPGPPGADVAGWLRRRVQAMLEARGVGTCVAAHIAMAIDQGRGWLLLDDLDRTPDRKPVRDALGVLRSWRTKLVVTGADGAFLRSLMPHEPTAVIAPLTPRQVRALVGSRPIRHDVRTPLAARLVVWLADHGQADVGGAGRWHQALLEELFTSPPRCADWLPALGGLAWAIVAVHRSTARHERDWLLTRLSELHALLPPPLAISAEELVRLGPRQQSSYLLQELLQVGLLVQSGGGRAALSFGDPRLLAYLAGTHAGRRWLDGDPRPMHRILDRLPRSPWPDVLAGGLACLAEASQARRYLEGMLPDLQCGADPLRRRLAALVRALPEAQGHLPEACLAAAAELVETWLAVCAAGTQAAYEPIGAAMPAALVCCPDVATLVRQRLASPHLADRMAAAALLAEFDPRQVDDEALGALRRLAEESDQDARQVASRTLARLDGPGTDAPDDGIERLLAQLETGRWQAREDAAEALIELVHGIAPADLGARLIRLLNHPERAVQMAAAEVLAELPAGLLGADVAELAGRWLAVDADTPRQLAALRLVAGLAPRALTSELLDRVLAQLHASDSALPAAALTALGGVGRCDPAAAAVALEQLESGRAEARLAAAGYLAGCDAPDLVDQLAERCDDLSAGDLTSRRCAALLARSAAVSADQRQVLLTRLLADPESAVRLAAIDSLVAAPAGGMAIAARLLAGLRAANAWERRASLRALGALGPPARPAVAEHLMPYLQAPSPVLRATGAELVAAFGGEVLPAGGLAIIVGLLEDENLAVRQAAARATRRLHRDTDESAVR